MTKHIVLTYLHFRILKFPLRKWVCLKIVGLTQNPMGQNLMFPIKTIYSNHLGVYAIFRNGKLVLLFEIHEIYDSHIVFPILLCISYSISLEIIQSHWLMLVMYPIECHYIQLNHHFFWWHPFKIHNRWIYQHFRPFNGPAWRQRSRAARVATSNTTDSIANFETSSRKHGDLASITMGKP